MSFFNGAAGAILNAPAAGENTSRQLPAVANNTISVITQGGGPLSGLADGDLHGEVSISIVGLLIVGLVVFYVWTRNIQGGG